MNAEPHTHEVQFTRTYNALQDGAYFVKYGDQEVLYALGWQRPERWSAKRLERRVKRATAKAVSRHDASSVRAGQEAEKLATARRVAQDAAKQVSSTWVR